MTKPRAPTWGSCWWRHLRTTHHLARHRTGWLAVGESDVAIHDCKFIAVRTLHEPPSVSRQIEDHFWRMKPQALEIDQINIRFHARRERSAIEQAIELRRVVRMALYRELKR